MKTLLTILATIASLSVYTLVGVHAKCGACPSSLSNNAVLSTQCTKKGITKCLYEDGESTLYCYFNKKGALQKNSNKACPKNGGTANNCNPCGS
ncbi:hypothetical protein PAXRUDRAFT_835174 [Paxillus rubicundulus Ve08.2h10]|uniref:Unplaced genomic scaffold scaffold_2409, whole genome shotgun sequence n=1 Tax=Paxillus rubicundulus Ve08.2h10 TaxID=930991 RepID=A0A0D0D4W3_9AGAM|nr:hypothetical protein PAXRUDRAFT_835825 [Paxillus rubicundulus Ve08.2h10]KIK76920.1 hypothetical protein PAXRUDRAFT_835174 [Paxillus rubicundulus Ve08.2h10]